MSTNEGAPESGGGEAQPDPFKLMREAGFDPDNTDWAEVAAKQQYVDALTDPNRHFDVLENSLREWGHLPEGQGLSDFFSEGGTEEVPPPGYPGYGPRQDNPSIIGYDADGDPIFSAPPGQAQQQPEFDAQAFEKHMTTQMEQRIEEATLNTQREITAAQMARDLEQQMEGARTQFELNDEESAYLWSNVRSKVGQMDGLTDPAQLRGIVEQEWKQIDALAQARLARTAQQASQAHRTTDLGTTPPARDGTPGERPFDSMMGETARRLGLTSED